MNEKALWLSHDLQSHGDMDGLYQFLDTYNALECGEKLAYLKYKYKDNFLSEFKDDISKSVDLGIVERIYIIYWDDDTKQINGKFLIGRRKKKPWNGFSPSNWPEIPDIL